MTNKTKKKVNLIPAFVLVAALFILYFVFMKDSDLFKIGGPPEVRRINGFPTVVYTDKQLEKRRIVVARLNHEVCEGCKMKVSAITLDRIFKGEDIVYCDNCGRILVHDEEKNLREAK